MNASANQPSRDRMTADQRANEPSMEEILASIRRIISESETVSGQRVETLKVHSPTVPVAEVVKSKADTVLLHRGTQPPTHIQDVSKRSIFDEPLDLRGSILPQSKVEDSLSKASGDQGLLSIESGKSITAAFSALSAASLAHENVNFDGIAREMLRPMLKSWLDDNLPTLVERLVRAEIERVARGTR